MAGFRLDLLSIVAGAVRLWVRVYTTWLPADVKNDRRAELESDLWEEVHAASHRPLAAAFQMLARWLLGIPADLSWCLLVLRAEFDAVKSSARQRREHMARQVVQRGLGLGVALAVAWLIVAVALNMTGPHQRQPLYQLRAEDRIGSVLRALNEDRMTMQDAFQELRSLAQEAQRIEREQNG